MLEREFAGQGRWFSSESTQGPGGGRNRLIGAATSPLIASFDDDSWPLDRDYFRLAAELFQAHPRAAVVEGQEVRPGMLQGSREGTPRQVACYQNCAA